MYENTHKLKLTPCTVTPLSLYHIKMIARTSTETLSNELWFSLYIYATMPMFHKGGPHFHRPQNMRSVSSYKSRSHENII